METLTIVLPMAGKGTRVRPWTWSRPKPLIYLAGKTVLDHILESLMGIPVPKRFVFIIGYLGEQIREHMARMYPDLDVVHVVQEEALGQSHALYLARAHLQGPTLVLFADTIMETRYDVLNDLPRDRGFAWVREVEDPRRFGVAVLNSQGHIMRIIEKPETTEHRLAVVGCYYFPEGKDLARAVTRQMEMDLRTKGEYYLADAINLLLEEGLVMEPVPVETWLDAGTYEALLETNRYLLEHGRDNTAGVLRPGLVVIPPVYVDPSAQVEYAVIGPYATIGPHAQVRHALIRDSIVDAHAQVENLVVEASLIGRHALLQGHPWKGFVGDHTRIVP